MHKWEYNNHMPVGWHWFWVGRPNLAVSDESFKAETKTHQHSADHGIENQANTRLQWTFRAQSHYSNGSNMR